MKNEEKAEMLKDAIYQLYSKEGRSISYISKLLSIDRKTISEKIKVWELPKPEPAKRLNPSTKKYIDSKRDYIISRLRDDVSESAIAKELKISRDRLLYLLEADDRLCQARKEYINRRHNRAKEKTEEAKERSRLQYDIEDIPGEEWKPILGYEDYEISNMGRVRRFAKRRGAYYLLKKHANKGTGRMYVMLYSGDKKANLLVSRLVAFSFCGGHSAEKNTVNHINGDITDDRAANLEWVSQSENNLHSYRTLNRRPTSGNQHVNAYSGKKFIYQERYEFKTVKALARFLGISETQTRRRLEDPGAHNLRITDKE